MTVSFNVDRVVPATTAPALIDASSLWKKRTIAAPEACAPGTFLDDELHPLLAAVRTAWNEHRPLRLTPDSVWLTIAGGFATHVNQNAEELRHHFVQHEGKKQLKIRRDTFVKGASDNDWPGAFTEFSDKIAEHIGKKRDLVVCDFSTTGPIERASSEVLLMDAMQSYFRYTVSTMCGFPNIELTGTVADWDSIQTRARALSEFGLEWWTKALDPVLSGLVATADGSMIDGDRTTFWRNFYNEDGGSGGPFLSGWINAFYPYLKPRKGVAPKNTCLTLEQRRESAFGGNSPSQFPSGIARAPFEWEYHDRVFPMQFLGGLIGVTVTDGGVLTPAAGWAIADATPEHKEPVIEGKNFLGRRKK